MSTVKRVPPTTKPHLTSPQKFEMGDYVKVVDPRAGGDEAIIIGSYADQYGGEDQHSLSEYTLHVKGGGKSSWYSESQLTLIERDRTDLLRRWKAEEKADRDTKSDLDWIFSHGAEVIEKMYGVSVEALAKCFGMTNLWGSRGEGITYYENALKTLSYANEFLVKGDKEGWIVRAKEIEEIIKQYREHKKVPEATDGEL